MTNYKKQTPDDIHSEESGTFGSVQEPAAEYITSTSECIEDCDTNSNFPIKFSEEEIEELLELDKYCDEHPEELIPFDVAMAKLKEKYGI